MNRIMDFPPPMKKPVDFSRVRFRFDPELSKTRVEVRDAVCGYRAMILPSEGSHWTIRFSSYDPLIGDIIHELVELTLAISIANIMWGDSRGGRLFLPSYLPFHDMTLLSLDYHKRDVFYSPEMERLLT